MTSGGGNVTHGMAGKVSSTHIKDRVRGSSSSKKEVEEKGGGWGETELSVYFQNSLEVSQIKLPHYFKNINYYLMIKDTSHIFDY